LKLVKIEIIGFKSFADRIKLEFHEGITGIVGPNGCGKSNIADAFRWVLGEQSAKSLRGGKMADVIFAGTSTRKPLNFAEVTITLGDINGALQVDYEEVAITRRLHRSGESEYFLNKQHVRLKDLQALFLDSGIGKDAYSIFEQGKIDLVINYTPLERRYIFEEAAGILRFLQRKGEALRRLEQSDLNIVRVKDIHQEIAQRIVILKTQAEKARLYKENIKTIEKLEKGIFLAKWELLQKRTLEIQNKNTDQQSLAEEINKQLEIVKTETLNAKNSLKESEKELKLKSEKVFKNRSEKEMKLRERYSTQERLKETTAKEKRWQLELEGMLEKQLHRQAERIQHQKQQKILEKELINQEGAVNSLRDKMVALEVSVSALRDMQQTKHKQYLHLLQLENQLSSELKQTILKSDSIEERLSDQLKKKEKFFKLNEEIVLHLREKQNQFDVLSQKIEDQKNIFEHMEETLNQLNSDIHTQRENLTKLEREQTEYKARQKALIRLKEDMEGFSEGTKRLLKESENPKSLLYQKLKGLHEYIVPKKGSEIVLAAAMKSYAQTLVVTANQVFEEVLAFAKKHAIKDFSLLCLDHLAKESTELFQNIECSKLIDQVEKSLLASHFLNAIVIVKTCSEGMNILKQFPESEICTEDGAFIDRRHVICYQSQGANNVFIREAEIKEIDDKLIKLETLRSEIEKELHKILEKKAFMHLERVEMDKIIRKSEMTLLELNFTLQRLKSDQENNKREQIQLDKDVEALNASKLQFMESITRLQQTHAEAKAKADQAIVELNQLQLEQEKQNSILKVEQKFLQEKEGTLNNFLEEKRKIIHILHVLDVKDTESQQQENRLQEEIELSRELKNQMMLKNSQNEEGMQEADKLLEEASLEYAEHEKAMDLIKCSIEKNEKQIHELQSSLNKYESTMYQCGVQKSQLESTCQALENELAERYQLTISDIRKGELKLEKSLDQSEKQIRTLRNEIEAAGDVNMTSIEEYETCNARYDFLNKELNDLNISKQELVGIIAQLEGESRKLFKKTFDIIKANFKKNFSILFNGGEADLQFTDGADVLEAGIEIIAKPPGKQMRSINLLSGGEKCMTAMALLFAIFEVKSSPFCILDEIDAPLDDSNVERFVNMLKQFIDKCQFIVITHNKRTMEIADILFGISMQEKGVSKILSMEFLQSDSPDQQKAVGLNQV
jgi:chromosome segregation protein